MLHLILEIVDLLRFKRILKMIRRMKIYYFVGRKFEHNKNS
jgi:hypothetical protein